MYRVLIVAPWGNPLGWSMVTYRVPLAVIEPTCKDDFIESSRRYRSVLGALLEVLTSKSVDVRALVVILDTLSLHSSECVRVNNYFRLRECVRDYVSRLLSGERGGEYVSTQVAEKIGIVVAPGFGTFRGVYGRLAEFRGFPENYYTVVFIEVLINMLEYWPDYIILDLSHGVNYMPVLTREAIFEASRIYAVLREGGLRVITVNSDPTPAEAVSKGSESLISRLNIVDCLTVNREDSLDGIYSALTKLDVGSRPVLAGIGGGDVRSLGETREKLQEELRVRQTIDKGILLSRLSKLGFILLIAYELRDLETLNIQELIERLRKLRKIFLDDLILSNIYFKDVNNTMTAIHRVRVNLNYLTAYVKSLTLQTVLSKLKREGPPYNLDYLNMLKEYLIVKDPAKTIVEHELWDTEMRIKEVQDRYADYRGKKLSYKYIYEVYESMKRGQEPHTQIMYSESEDECVIDRRILYAHAGLQKEAIIVLIGSSSNDISLEYRSICLDKIKDLILRSPIA